MEGGLCHNYRPRWLFLEDSFESSKQLLKGHIHGLHHHEQHMGFRLKRSTVLARIVPGFAQATGVEKDRQRKICLRKIVPGSPARTGCKARPNLYPLRTSQGADD